jgi:hypothetical protein
METRALLNLFLADLGQYCRQRIFTFRIGFLITLLVAMGFLVEMPLDMRVFSQRLFWMSLLVIQFRFWDDLADLPYDRVHYPDRILVRTELLCTFESSQIALMTLLFILLFISKGLIDVYFYCATVFWIAFVYYAPWKLFLNRLVRTQCLLLKYPLFIVLTTTSGSVRREIVIGALVYILFSTFEWNDDPELRKGYRGAKIVVLSASALVVILGYFNHG